MVVAGQDSSMAGITNNPGFIIDPRSFVSGGLAPQTDNTSIFLDGDYILVSGPNVKIFETDWYGTGTFRDNVLLRAVFDSNGLSNYTIALRCHIHSKYPGSSTVTTNTIYFPYDTFMSFGTGTPQQLLNFNSRCTDYLQFDPRKQYKFEFFTGQDLELTDTLSLDYIFAQPMPRGQILHAEEQGYWSDPYGGINYSTKEPITITESFKASITCDQLNGSNYQGTLQLARVQKGESIGDGKFVGYYKKIDNVFVQPVYNATLFTNNKQIGIMVDPSTLDPNDGITAMTATEGCYAPKIYVNSNATTSFTLAVMVHITGKVAPRDV